MTEKQFDALERLEKASPFTTPLTRHVGDALVKQGLADGPVPKLPGQLGTQYRITRNGLAYLATLDEEVMP